MNTLYLILLIYVCIAFIIALLYTYLFNKYFMPSEVIEANRLQKLGSLTMLFISVLCIAPYGLYEMIKTYRNGGFKK